MAVDLPRSIDMQEIEPEVASLIAQARERIQAFQDRWDQPQIEQFVASDYELVYRVLRWTVDERLLMGRRMLEWGCGFAVVAALASRLGLDAFGIEAEPVLLRQARGTIESFSAPVELIEGNFLPSGADVLSADPDFPSLGHDTPSAYARMGLDLDDFSLVFGYPWPGEHVFHQAVFAKYGAPGALLVLFCGPNDVRVWRRSG